MKRRKRHPVWSLSAGGGKPMGAHVDQAQERAVLRRRIYTALGLLVAMLAMTVFNVWYTNKVHRDGERAFCEVLDAQVDAYQQRPPSPPLTPTGQRIADALTHLHERYGC